MVCGHHHHHCCVEFDADEFKEQYPQFESQTEATLLQYFSFAEMLCDNSCHSIVRNLCERQMLLYLLVAHIATLQTNEGDYNAGTLQSATEGKVSVTFATDSTDSSDTTAWLKKTMYGELYYRATAKYRMGIRWYG